MGVFKKLIHKKINDLEESFTLARNSNVERIKGYGERSINVGKSLSTLMPIVTGGLFVVLVIVREMPINSVSEILKLVIPFAAFIFGGLLIGMICYGICSAIKWIYSLIARSVSKKQFRSEFKGSLFLESVNEIDERIQELDKLEKEKQGYAEKLEVNFLTEHHSKILLSELESKELQEIYDNIEELKKKTSKLVHESILESKHLKNCGIHYNHTMELYTDANYASQISQNATCINFSNRLLLLIEQSKKYIIRRSWKEFGNTIDKLNNNIQILKENAKNASKSEYMDSENDETTETYQENDPYSILDILPWATDEEVLKAIKKQVKLYHPDKYFNNNREDQQDYINGKIKRIYAARDKIKEERNL